DAECVSDREGARDRNRVQSFSLRDFPGARLRAIATDFWNSRRRRSDRGKRREGGTRIDRVPGGTEPCRVDSAGHQDLYRGGGFPRAGRGGGELLRRTNDLDGQ